MNNEFEVWDDQGNTSAAPVLLPASSKSAALSFSTIRARRRGPPSDSSAQTILNIRVSMKDTTCAASRARTHLESEPLHLQQKALAGVDCVEAVPASLLASLIHVQNLELAIFVVGQGGVVCLPAQQIAAERWNAGKFTESKDSRAYWWRSRNRSRFLCLRSAFAS
jgi:hypothetical protein